RTPLYGYRFGESPQTTFAVTEARAALRWSPGERFVRTALDRISRGTPYPEVWVQRTRGLDGVLGGRFDFRRWDVQVRQRLRVRTWGTFSGQLQGGFAEGELPYPVLYNVPGSFKAASVVTHNSFETMRYNEFAADRYLFLFLSHNFGKLYEGSAFVRPVLEVAHNAGWGGLRRPDAHQGDFRALTQGYYEAGAYLTDLVVVPLPGIKVGLGLGVFARYGPYAGETFGDNAVYKLAVRFHP
ncbi:MAG: DUF5686 family protein, partial [Catalinimonas sp.]